MPFLFTIKPKIQNLSNLIIQISLALYLLKNKTYRIPRAQQIQLQIYIFKQLNKMQKPNYHYNYNYSPNSSRKQQQPNPNGGLDSQYIKHNVQYQPQQSNLIQYYPISEQERVLSPKRSQSSENTSFIPDNNYKQRVRKESQTSSQQVIEYLQINTPGTREKWYQSTKSFYHNQVLTAQQRQQQVRPMQKIKAQNTTSPIQQYLSWLYEAFDEFEKTSNLKIIKKINQKNSAQTFRLFQQLYQQKQLLQLKQNDFKIQTTHSLQQNDSTVLPQEMQLNVRKQQIQSQIHMISQQNSQLTKLMQKQSQSHLQLQEQLQQQIQIYQGRNLHGSRVRQQNHLKQMQYSIIQLQDQIRVLQRKNTQLSKAVVSLPFFREWNLMFQEAKGATKLGIKLKQEIEKRQLIIKQMTDEDPSNNTETRSVRRLMSESAEKGYNFNKKQSNLQATDMRDNGQNNSTSRPLSQMPHKFQSKPESCRSNDVVIKHLSHSNRFSQSKKAVTVNNSMEKPKQRKQSYDQKPQIDTFDWKGISFPQNLKNIGLKFIGTDFKR